MKPSLLILPLLVFASPSARVAGDDEIREADSIEDVEIMRRILVQEVAGELRGQEADVLPLLFDSGADASFLGTSLGLSLVSSEPVSQSRGFYLPGSGVILTLEVTAPVRPVEPGSDEAAPGDDPWTRMERQVRGQEAPTSNPGRRPGTFMSAVREVNTKRWVIDAEVVDRIEDVLLDTLARHGARIEGLDPGETVTVAVRVSPGAARRPVILGEGGDIDANELGWLATHSVERAPLVHLVVQMRRQDMLEPGDERDAAEAGRRALIHRY